MSITSFIIVNRGGKDLPIVIENIERTYNDMDKEILVINQGDELPFLRGQLFNIGVKYATGHFIALQDNDIYHLRKVPWIQAYTAKQIPLIGFKAISQVTITNGMPNITSTEWCLGGFGGFNFMQRKDFITFNGFSNLFVGWGFEDNEYSLRFKCERVPQNLGHLTHPRRMYLYKKNRDFNLELYHSAKQRDFSLDGYQQTVYKELSQTSHGQVKYITVSDITVTNHFKYKDLLDTQWQLVYEQSAASESK